MNVHGFNRARSVFWGTRLRTTRGQKTAANALLDVLAEHPDGEAIVDAATAWLRDNRLCVPPEWAERREAAT